MTTNKHTLSELKATSVSTLRTFFQEKTSENMLSSYVEAFKNAPRCVMPIKNAMFNLLLDQVLGANGSHAIFIKTEEWLDDNSISGLCFFSTETDKYCFGLSHEQTDILEQAMNIPRQDALYWQKIVAMTCILESDNLTDEEKEHPFVRNFNVKENSKTIEVTETTSRFSSATWFEEIQKKTIILAGLGGIGSYVCFLLARMHPKSMFLYDDDVVEVVNMSGQLYGLSDVNEYKSNAISAMIRNYADYNSVFASTERFTSDCEAHDIMICGFDNMQARRIFFEKWRDHVISKDAEERDKCLFIDGRLSAEVLQVYCITGDNCEAQDKYYSECLFDDSQADETICSYKQTTYMANMIGSIIVNLFTNFVANEVAGAPIRELPFLTSYDGYSMQLKLE